MLETKFLFSITAIILVIVGYLPYLRDTIREKTTPHVYAWFISGFVTAIIFALQFTAGGGPGSWVSLAVIGISIIIFFLSLKNRKKDITKIDTLFFALAIVTLLIWLVLKQPVISAILATSVDMLGFAPTIRKSWNKPYSETLFTYEVGVLRHGLTFLALRQYNIITWLNPVSWFVVFIFFSLTLILRRKKIGSVKNF